MNEANEVARDYLKAPYSRILIPDDETGTYTAKIAEFPGCVAQGDSPEEAYQNLEAAAESWIEELLGMGEGVPEPAASNSYSGRVALRLPKSLHRNAAQLAEREGTSLNQFLVAAVAERVGAGTLYAEVARRLAWRAMQAVVSSVQVNTDRAWNESAATWPLGWANVRGSGTPFVQAIVREPSTERGTTGTVVRDVDLVELTEHGG